MDTEELEGVASNTTGLGVDSLLDGPTNLRGGIVTARGTGDGLVLRIDARVEREGLEQAVRDFVASRRDFLKGNDVALEWVGGHPSPEKLEGITETLESEFSIAVRRSETKAIEGKLSESRQNETRGKLSDQVIEEIEDDNIFSRGEGSQSKKGSNVATLEVHRGQKKRAPLARIKSGSSDSSSAPSLFDGIDVLDESNSESSAFARSTSDRPLSRQISERQVDPMAWDDADARIIYATLRSGQRIETEHSLVVFGDVNSGAELIAGGDIIVLGTLRGVAHAGAYDETGAGRVIFALTLAPMQLRIGAVISRGAADGSVGPEIARVDGELIVVERYQARTVLSRRK